PRPISPTSERWRNRRISTIQRNTNLIGITNSQQCRERWSVNTTVDMNAIYTFTCDEWNDQSQCLKKNWQQSMKPTKHTPTAKALHITNSQQRHNRLHTFEILTRRNTLRIEHTRQTATMLIKKLRSGHHYFY